jgi:alkyl hydroperoxide reductase subunit AhpC
MKNIGEKALTFRSPAVVNGNRSYLNLEQYRGQWVAVSFVPGFSRMEAELLNRYSTDVELLGTTLLLVSRALAILGRESALGTALRFPLVEDPLGRLQGPFGGSTARTWGRARTFLLDPEAHFGST